MKVIIYKWLHTQITAISDYNGELQLSVLSSISMIDHLFSNPWIIPPTAT